MFRAAIVTTLMLAGTSLFADFEVLSGTCEQEYLNLIWGDTDDGTFDMLDFPKGGYSGWVGMGYWENLTEECSVTARKLRNLEYDSKGYYYQDEFGNADFDIVIQCDQGLNINGSGIGNCIIINISSGSTIYNGSPSNLQNYHVEPGTWRFKISPNMTGGCETWGDEWYSITECNYYGECTIDIEPVVVCNDITGDGIVGVADLLSIIDQWGLTDSPADINDDGVVNVSDLLLIISNWGPCE